MPGSPPFKHIRLGAILGALCVLAAGADARAQANPETRFCSEAAPNVVLYLDVTTPYDAADKEALVDGISKIFERMQGGSRLSMRTIADAFSRGRRLIETCAPYCPETGFFSDLLSDCTEGIVINERKRQRRLVSEKLLEQMEARSELAHSEIIRTIAVSAKEEYIEGRENRFYIFSDMIENSEFMPGAEFFRRDNSEILLRLEKDGLIPYLAGAEVRIFGIGRGGNSATREALSQERLNKINSFWELFFSATGASVTMQQNLGFTD